MTCALYVIPLIHSESAVECNSTPLLLVSDGAYAAQTHAPATPYHSTSPMQHIDLCWVSRCECKTISWFCFCFGRSHSRLQALLWRARGRVRVQHVVFLARIHCVYVSVSFVRFNHVAVFTSFESFAALLIQYFSTVPCTVYFERFRHRTSMWDSRNFVTVYAVSSISTTELTYFFLNGFRILFRLSNPTALMIVLIIMHRWSGCFHNKIVAWNWPHSL